MTSKRSDARLRSPTAQRTRRRSNLRCASIRSAVDDRPNVRCYRHSACKPTPERYHHANWEILGDLWFADLPYDDPRFESRILALIECKNRFATIGNRDWREAMGQGRIKARSQKLKSFFVTNTLGETRCRGHGTASTGILKSLRRSLSKVTRGSSLRCSG